MDRKKSSIIKIRVFHNWIKLRLLERASTMVSKNPRILDLAVGRGADLYKWNNINASEVYGFDIDKKSLDIAMTKYRAISNPKPKCHFIRVNKKSNKWKKV